jgi:hypothetical protein
MYFHIRGTYLSTLSWASWIQSLYSHRLSQVVSHLQVFRCTLNLHACYISGPAFPIWFGDLNTIWRGTWIMNLVCMWLYRSSFCVLCIIHLRPKQVDLTDMKCQCLVSYITVEMARNCGIIFVNLFCSATIRTLVVRPIRVFGSVVALLCYSSAGFHTVASVEPLSFLDTLSSVFMKLRNRKWRQQSPPDMLS